ncbi:DegT/DnrJ/EryC1/StrS family aminotransferase [Eubacterium multiforme]|uniref:dTDP-4-amino-4,6-dideoxygalactose transaminase n=1 Tax=Eubacterium multiforme TaxID=83339 RepID=A0ABT9UX22_9FIRM|nr:DegT/DnrJ/EryC1/StrS family aminotransferase [Eubacterium multiforme]MDQ0150872.1 dTDP-4-amino-4,6-dideoxygalactose transaminase [Eubacterium multiforme]
MEYKKIFLSSPHMGGDEEKFIKEAFNSNWIAPLGPNVNNFEKEVSKYLGIKYGAALISGTAAIHMALKAIGIKRRDRILCSTLTFSASCNPIIYEGGEPIFIDSEEESWNMCPYALEKAFLECEREGKLPKAIIVVHLYGQSANMDKIIKLCNKYNCKIIEDAAESLGATYKGIQTGTLGDFGIFSFNGNKIITTSGGGMIVSNDKEKIEKIKFWSTQARENERHYEHKELGFNYRISNIVAGIGRGQLKVLNERIKKKKEIFETYKEGFKDISDIKMMPIKDYGTPNYWLSCITLSRESKVKPIDIILALERENIEARPIWKPMHMQPLYNKYKFFTKGKKSIAEDIFNRGVCLPSDTKNTEKDMVRIIEIIKKLFI